MDPAATSSSVPEGIPYHVSESDESIGERTEDSRHSDLFSQPWRTFVSRTSARFSIGPRMLFLLTKEKTESTEVQVGQFEAESPADNWAFTKYLWNETEKLARLRGFKGYLSTAQYHSFTMLFEWLHSHIESQDVVQWFQHSLYDTNTEDLVHECQDDNSHIANEKFRQSTLYQKVMADLFRIEFSPAHWVGAEEDLPGSHELRMTRFRKVDECRRLAWQARTAQRISWKFTSVSWNQGVEFSTNCNVFKNPLARMDYCPWLNRDLSRDGFPRYLWNIREKKTVDTVNFPKRERYTCVSHTWGRWRKKEWAQIPNISWRVPLNTRFDVEALPETFYNMKDRFTTDYIWIDLFCMPQDTSDPHLAKILTEEIPRQAVIFQNATSCIAWLNYIHHWVAEYCTIGWLSAKYMELSSQPGMCDVQPLLDAAKHGCTLPLQLTRFEPPTFGRPKWKAKPILWRDRLDKWWRWKRRILPFYHSEPSDWFSGAWTLQEAYLRPNMVLADEEWNILSDAAGEPISLEELFALVHVVFSLGSWGTRVLGHFLIEGHGIENCPIDEVMAVHYDKNFEQQAPPGPRQLEALVAKTHLFSSSVVSRVDPLIQANGRFCTAGRSGRAEAIMSSLGITNWFKEKPRVIDNDLVLGMYPLRFLQEAASAIGPDFYTASADSPSFWPVFNLLTRRTGSMMPFRHAKEKKYRISSITTRGTLPYPEPKAQHPSVSTWNILKNGSVRITEAVVLGSNRIGYVNIQAIVALAFWGSRFSESNVYVLSNWIEAQPKSLDTFAVSLTEKRSEMVGLLLQGRRVGRSTRLVKVGIIGLDLSLVETEYWPNAQPVDWIVV